MEIAQFFFRFVTMASFSDSMKFIKYITETYFSGESLLLVYWTNVSVEFREDLLDYWMKSEILTVETCNCDYVTDDIVWERSYVKNTVVLFGDLVPERRHIETIRQCRAWNARSKILAIVNDSDDVANVTLNKIWMFTKAINVTTMVSTTSSVKYYTLYPYENFKIVELDKTGLFPPKSLDNLHKSIISVASTASEPYVMTSTTSNEFTEGLEIRIINTISKKFNFQIKFIPPPKGENPWTAMSSDKRKTNGNFRLLYRCEADVLFHGFPIAIERLSLADVTAVHTLDKIVWILPTRPFSFNWRSIIILFKNELWALIFATLVLMAVTLFAITKYEFGGPKTSYDALDAFFQAFGIHFGVPIHFYRTRQLYRLFIFTISYYTMIIVALYQSSLITHLTTPGSGDQYNTIEEAVDDNLIGYFFYASKALLNLSDHHLYNKILQPGKHLFLQKGIDALSYVAHNKTGFTRFSGNYALFNVHKYFLNEDHEPMVKIIQDGLKMYLVSIFTSRGHPLNGLINMDVLRLKEGGILIHWMKEILEESVKIKNGGSDDDDDDGPKALGVEHLKGAFYILPFMFSIAGMVFVGELVYYWWTVKKIEEFNAAPSKRESIVG